MTSTRKKKRSGKKGAEKPLQNTPDAEKKSSNNPIEIAQQTLVSVKKDVSQSCTTDTSISKATSECVFSEESKLQLEPNSEGSLRKKKKKKKKKKRKDIAEVQEDSTAVAPSPKAEAGCCSLKNLKDISCLELICPHSNKSPAQAFSQQKSSEAASSSKCSSGNPGSDGGNQHLDTLSDAIVKGLACLDRTSISITLVNPEKEKAASEKVAHSLHEQLPKNNEIVIDICGTGIVEVDDPTTLINQACQGPSTRTSVGKGAKQAPKNVIECFIPMAITSDSADTKKQPVPGGTKASKAVQKSGKPKLEPAEKSSLGCGSLPLSVDKANDPSSSTSAGTPEKTKAQLKAERKAAFEAQRAALASQENEGGEAGGKTKADLRAERRALQELQRAAKAQGAPKAAKESSAGADGAPVAKSAATKQPHSSGSKAEEKLPVGQQQDVPKKPIKKPVRETKEHKERHLLSHLHQNPGTVDHLRSYGLSGSSVHPAVFRIGLQIAEGVLTGSNRRCIAMLGAFSSVIKDYTSQENKRISQDIREQLDCAIHFLKKCRPLSVSMQNAISFLKGQISEIPHTEPSDQVKKRLIDLIDKFLYEELCLAKKQITEEAQKKILDGDVILTYSCSSLVKSVLKVAHKSGKDFRVVIAESRPKLEGKEMLS